MGNAGTQLEDGSETVVTLFYILKRSGQSCQAILQLMPIMSSYELIYFTGVG